MHNNAHATCRIVALCCIKTAYFYVLLLLNLIIVLSEVGRSSLLNHFIAWLGTILEQCEAIIPLDLTSLGCQKSQKMKEVCLSQNSTQHLILRGSSSSGIVAIIIIIWLSLLRAF